MKSTEMNVRDVQIKIAEMMEKAGETGPITETKADFKEGLQRTKAMTKTPLPIPPLLRGDTEGLWRNPTSPARMF